MVVAAEVLVVVEVAAEVVVHQEEVGNQVVSKEVSNNITGNCVIKTKRSPTYVYRLFFSGKTVIVEPHRHDGVFIARGKEDALVTRNLVPGSEVYGEKRISVEVSEMFNRFFFL